jgi:hypothetical protein
MRSVSARRVISTASSGAPASLRCGQCQTLAGGERGHHPYRHSILCLFREGSDDMKAVALDSVVGDRRHIAEIDDLTLEGL